MSGSSAIRWVILDTALSRGLSFVSFVVVARFLGPQTMGLVAVLLLVKEMAALVSDFGLTQAVIQYSGPSNRQLATLYSLNWVLGVLAYFIVIFSSAYISNFFHQPSLVELLPYIAIGFLLEPIGQQVNALLQKEMAFQTLAQISIFSAIIASVLSIGGVYAGLGIWAVVISSIVSSVMRQVAYLIVASRNALLSGFALDLKVTKPLLSFGLYRTGATALNFINSRADQIIIGGLLNTSQLGIYTIATSWTLFVMQQINGIATKVAFPAISRFQSETKRVKMAYLRLVNRVTTVNACVFIGLAVSADPLVVLVLGPGWDKLVPVLQLMCLYALLRSLGNLNGPLAMGLGKAKWAFYWNLALSLVVPATLFLAARGGSLEMVVVALIVLQLSSAILMYIYWTRRLIGPCLKEYLISIAAPLCCGAVMGIIAHIILQAARFAEPQYRIALVLPIGAIAYIGMSAILNRSGLRDLLSVLFKGGRPVTLNQ